MAAHIGEGHVGTRIIRGGAEPKAMDGGAGKGVFEAEGKFQPPRRQGDEHGAPWDVGFGALGINSRRR